VSRSRQVEANAEAMPFADNAFDVVMSCVGVMFAPHHQDAADELIRVYRPGGTIGMINCTPDGFIGNMFATIAPYAPPPPPGAGPPPM
jgi:ubiquinone/menaquinone biosynthesis C-methylase UbiE